MLMLQNRTKGHDQQNQTQIVDAKDLKLLTLTVTKERYEYGGSAIAENFCASVRGKAFGARCGDKICILYSQSASMLKDGDAVAGWFYVGDFTADSLPVYVPVEVISINGKNL
jgi:hypothetical protein